VGFEPTIPESERAKTVHALGREATVTGKFFRYWQEMRTQIELIVSLSAVLSDSYEVIDALLCDNFRTVQIRNSFNSNKTFKVSSVKR
jgi:hypothetical protein